MSTIDGRSFTVCYAAANERDESGRALLALEDESATVDEVAAICRAHHTTARVFDLDGIAVACVDAPETSPT